MVKKQQTVKATEEDLPNFLPVSKGILRGGQPSERGFLHLKEVGVRTIINLRDERWLVRSEAEIAASLGFKYVSIPLSPFAEPHLSAIQQFLSVIYDKDNHKVFIHCQHGRDRTGMMVSLYRIESDGWTIRQAYEEMLEKGFSTEFSNLTQALIGYARNKKPNA